jgi:hypothetical protein
MCLQAIYAFPGSVHLFPAAEYADRSQTHEGGNWDCGCAIPFLGIFVLNFQYWFFSVCMGRLGTRQELKEEYPWGTWGRVFQNKQCIIHINVIFTYMNEFLEMDFLT